MENKEKRRRKVLCLNTKLRIIELFNCGQSKSKIGRELNLNEATIRTVLKNADKYRDLAKTVSNSSMTQSLKNRNPLMIEMEDLLSIWVQDCNKKRIPICKKNITDKAISLFSHLKDIKYNDLNVTFTGSTGWFENFKVRAGIKNIKLTGEAASADQDAALQYPEELQKIIRDGNYDYRQIFNADETGLFWKKMPSRTFLARSEETQPGYKISKDRITLLLGGNAAGDFKLKPLLVSKSLNPRALKNIKKEELPVIWRANKKGWVTKVIFEDWFQSYFCPAVENYCKVNNLAFKALLLLDNAPGHPFNLNNFNDNIKVIFLPPNTTALLQPMDQGAIATFKAYYMRRVFAKAVEATTGDNPILLQQFWKNFNIYDAVKNINYAWEEVTPNCMKGVWHKILPASLPVAAIEYSANIAINDCISFENELGFNDMDAENVLEVFVDTALSNDDLIERQKENIENEEDEEDEDEQMATNELEGLFHDIDNIKKRIIKIDPDINRCLKVCNGLENQIACYREIFSNRKSN